MGEYLEYCYNLKNDLKYYTLRDEIVPKISVIIPCYNVEKYLETCLDSLLKQTFKEFEIICIDDGSTDYTPMILNAYNGIDSRFKLISQENKGPSSARNKGICAAKGEYITFVDSDDWIDNDFLEKHYSAIIRHNADISTSSIIRCRENNKKYRVHYIKEEIHETLEDKIKICDIPNCCYVWNKLYKANLVKSHLFEEGKFFEDVLWIPEVLKQSKKIVTVPNVTYYYRATKASIVKKFSPQKQFDSYCAKKYIINFFDSNNLKLSEKQKNITKEIKYFLNILVLKTKEYKNIEQKYLFGFMPICKKNVPYIDNNTFIVWEPCSTSHGEVVPGYAKYLLDLGYEVSVIVNPSDIKDGLTITDTS